jgi:hypothetical protein
MPYTLRVWFTGLVHFVENKDPIASCQMCVVLPVAGGHRAAIYLVRRETSCGKLRLRPADPPLLTLTRRRVVFQVTRVDDARPQPRTSFNEPFGILGLDQIAGEFVDEFDLIVSDGEPPDSVQAQLLFEGGYSFGTDPELSVLRQWILPGTLSGAQTYAWVADPVYIDIPDVASATMLDSPLDEAEVRAAAHATNLAPGGNGLIEVLVSNRCMPAGFTADDISVEMGDNRLTIFQIDDDFTFNYTVLSPTTRSAIEKILPPRSQQAPQYPLPKSMLVDIQLAPHLCPPWLRDPARCSKPDDDGPEGVPRVSELLEILAMLAKTILSEEGTLGLLLTILNALFPEGTGTGSGSDCLGTRGAARFMDLDYFIPSAPPSLDPGTGQVLSRARRRTPSPQVEAGAGNVDGGGGAASSSAAGAASDTDGH